MATDEGKERPHLTDKARREAEAKRERLAQALRENLRRRKAQDRARSQERSPPKDACGDESGS